MKQLPLKLSLNPNSTFDNFFANSNNAVVVNTLQHFVHDDEHFLYLWAQPGDGVTHLLEAVQHILSYPISCQYLPLKAVLDYPPEAITEGLEQLDIICIDDIDLVVNQPDWQQALFYLYNQLRDGGKKLIVAGHCSPRELSIELQDLKSRLQWGAVLYLEPLDDEQKILALKQKAKTLGMDVSDEVLNFILSRVRRNNSALYQVLSLLDQESMAAKRKLTIPFVKQVLASGLLSLS